jgi:uncharacterized protein YjaZ
VKRGSETKGNFLEYLINEGQADEFAKSLYPNHQPSWHKGVTGENEQYIWNRLKKFFMKLVLHKNRISTCLAAKNLAFLHLQVIISEAES